MPDENGKPHRITRLTAWLSVDAAGDEGVVAILDGSTGAWVPLIASDRVREEAIEPEARSIERLTGRPVRKVYFMRVERI
jgi:hypothetical protein